VEDAIVPIVATLVGAAAALAGSIWVNRWNATRSARVELLRNLIPEIIDRIDREDWLHLPGRLDALARAALTANRRDRKQTTRLRSLAGQIESNLFADGEMTHETRELVYDLRRELRAYDAWLADRV
jgi:hypothetical protein